MSIIKDSCNNYEKNAILRGHAQGVEIPEIARQLLLTERIVENIIENYDENGVLKSKKKQTEAKGEFSEVDPGDFD